MKQPLVSVILSAYNEENYLKDSIESILSQTFADFEFVIINDGSTDKTQDILQHYAQNDRRIKLVANERNSGVAKSLNKGIKAATGEYIAITDAGDTSHPERLEKQVELLESNRAVYIVGTWAYWINENKEIIGKWGIPTKVDVAQLYKTGGPIHPSIMINRKLFEAVGLYDTKYESREDYELYLRALRRHFVITNIPEFLISVMRRDCGIQFRQIRKNQINLFKIRLKYLPYFLSFFSIFYTLRSLSSCLLPSFLLRIFAERRVRNSKLS